MIFAKPFFLLSTPSLSVSCVFAVLKRSKSGYYRVGSRDYGRIVENDSNDFIAENIKLF